MLLMLLGEKYPASKQKEVKKGERTFCPISQLLQAERGEDGVDELGEGRVAADDRVAVGEHMPAVGAADALGVADGLDDDPHGKHLQQQQYTVDKRFPSRRRRRRRRRRR